MIAQVIELYVILFFWYWTQWFGCVWLLYLHVCISFYSGRARWDLKYTEQYDPEQTLMSLQRKPQQMYLLSRKSCWWQQMFRYFSLKLFCSCYRLDSLGSAAYCWHVSHIMWWITSAVEMTSFWLHGTDPLSSFSFISITGLCFSCYGDDTQAIDSNVISPTWQSDGRLPHSLQCWSGCQ